MKLTVSYVLLFLYFQSVELSSDVNEDCAGAAKFKPEDEKDSLELQSFNKMLQEKTFNNVVSLSHPKCINSKCILDPVGKAVWLARENLYKKYSIYSEHHAANTLDGCFCDSETIDELNSCLKQVRIDMTHDLGSFNDDLAAIIQENNCQAFFANCLNI
nr:unnamed protein product [Callosobruchus chinensis]